MRLVCENNKEATYNSQFYTPLFIFHNSRIFQILPTVGTKPVSSDYKINFREFRLPAQTLGKSYDKWRWTQCQPYVFLYRWIGMGAQMFRSSFLDQCLLIDLRPCILSKSS